jgi:hypothetical protein
MNLVSAKRHKWPFRTSLAECPVSGVKQALGNGILEGYDLNARERLLSPIADIRSGRKAGLLRAANGHKRTLSLVRNLKITMAVARSERLEVSQRLVAGLREKPSLFGDELLRSATPVKQQRLIDAVRGNRHRTFFHAHDPAFIPEIPQVEFEHFVRTAGQALQ